MQNAPLSFKIHGLDCAEEVAVLRREVGPIVGGSDRLAFDILNAKMTVLGQSNRTTVTDVLDAVRRTGMSAELWRGPDENKQPSTPNRRLIQAYLTAASGLFALLGFVVHAWNAGGVFVALAGSELNRAHQVSALAITLYSLGILAGIWSFLPKAWHSLRRLRPDMNLLMAIAVGGAIAIGEWSEAATVAFLFSLSLALEAWSVGRARRAVQSLLNLAPNTVCLIMPDGIQQDVSPSAVEISSRFRVRPGERIALDGVVIAGTSHVNQSPITGESVPVEKFPGQSVFAGTINGDGALDIKATHAADDTTLAHIIQLVGEAQTQRAPVEKWVDRFARIYTPAIMALAALVLVVPPLFLGGSWRDWIYNALVLLVIACPCALVISTPVAIVAALTAAARHGVLIKGGLHVETPARLRAIAFDKTGTLTEGKPVVAEVVPLNGHTEKELVERAAGMESHSDHPLAQAIVAYARERGIPPLRTESFQLIQGKGATARFDGRQFWLGSHRYLEERQQETPDVHRRLEELSAAGKTIVVVGNDRHVCGFIALSDRVRSQSEIAIERLRTAGIRHTIMLTGDNLPTAQAIANQTGVDEFRAELLPADKVMAVEDLVDRFQNVAMVGDGINDAPALARASLGIAMGAAGSDAAIETADIALMSDDLLKIPWLVEHSRRTINTIRTNIAFSLALKAAFVVLALLGHATLWAAIAVDTGASLVVIFNGLRLLRSPSGAA